MPVSLSSIDDAQAPHRLERSRSRTGRCASSVGSCGARRDAWNACCSPSRTMLRAAVEDAEVRVQRGADAEVELAVVLVAVEPVAVVGVAVAGRGLRDRLRRLVDRVVVELAQHGASYHWIGSGRPQLTSGVRRPVYSAPMTATTTPPDLPRLRRSSRPTPTSPSRSSSTPSGSTSSSATACRASRPSGDWRTLVIENLRPAQADARVRARGRDRRRLRRRRPPARPGTRRRQRRGDLPDVRAAGVLRVRRRRAPAAAVPGVQQLGDRGVRRPRGCSPSASCRCSTSTARSRTRSASPSRASARCSCPRRFRSARTTTTRTTRSGPSPQDLGLPLTFHSGTGHEPRVVRGPGGAVVNYLLGAQLDGPMVMLTMAAGGALDRFPGLQLVTVETGAGVARVDHDAGRRDLRGPQHVREAEAVAEAERADPAPVRRHVHVRPGRDQQPRDHRRRDARCGATTTRTPKARGPTSQDVAADQFAGVLRRRRRTRSSAATPPRSSASTSMLWRRIPRVVKEI